MGGGISKEIQGFVKDDKVLINFDTIWNLW